MGQERSKKYDASGNVEAQYVDAAQTVLVNLCGISDLPSLQIAEGKALVKAYEVLFGEVTRDTPITCELLKHIHQRIFGDLFDWAGRWRTIQISKPGAIWPTAQYLDQSMQTFERDVLNQHPAESLGDDEQFCSALGEIQGEFLAIHPFREGNARTIKVATDLLSLQTGRPLLVYDSSERGASAYINAASAALLKKDYRPMKQIIRQALTAARNQP